MSGRNSPIAQILMFIVGIMYVNKTINNDEISRYHRRVQMSRAACAANAASELFWGLYKYYSQNINNFLKQFFYIQIMKFLSNYFYKVTDKL